MTAWPRPAPEQHPPPQPSTTLTGVAGSAEGEASEILHWRAGEVSLVLATGGGCLPRILHWGADLGGTSEVDGDTQAGNLDPEDLLAFALSAAPPASEHPTDVVHQAPILPEHSRGWIGRPAIQGSRAGADWSTALTLTSQQEHVTHDGTRRLVSRAGDSIARLAVDLEIELTPSGLLRLRAALTNAAGAEQTEPYQLEALRLLVPVPGEADELLDFTGRHTRERIPQRQSFAAGLHSREARHGRTGLDAVHLLCAGRQGFSWSDGEVWAVHLGWSANQEHYAERLYNGSRALGAGELLLPGEVRLGPGATYTTPWLFASYGQGLNAVAGQFHTWLRARPHHPARPRPVTVNTWEAIYFDQDHDRLTALAETAAGIGVERFVLDDGWFGSRRDDTSGLGDWRVSPDVWPEGLHPLVDRVRSLGMEFGLWVEPEMANLDSDLVRAHPEWLFSTGGRTGEPSRNQHVLDLAHPGAYAHVRDLLQAMLDEYEIAYLKWDHNRYLIDAGHTPGGQPGVHAHTRAVYRLLDEIRAANPGLEIESCASGGGRVDLGILERTDRIWASDTNDALERQDIQRWTQLLVPPEMIGTHVGPPHSHTTGRTHSLAFRAGTALWGHMGVEWDLTDASQADLEQLGAWIALHKELRTLLHTGTVVNGDHPDESVHVHGVVAADGADAVYALVALGRAVSWPPGRARLPGLAPDRRYKVRLQPPGDDAAGTGPHPRPIPPWCRAGTVLTGRSLAVSGVQLPMSDPEQLVLVRATAL